LLRKADRVLALPAPKRADETDVENEGRTDRLGGRVIDCKDRLPRRRLAEPVELHARAIDATSPEGLEVSGELARDLDLPLWKQNAVDERVRIDFEDGLEDVPPPAG